MTTYITQEQILAIGKSVLNKVDAYDDGIGFARDIEAAAIQAYRDSLVAGVVLPEVPDADYLGADGVGDIFGYEERHMQDYARQAIADALAKQVPQWQPIETAPKDGTQIVVPSQWSGQDADIASFDTNKSAWFSVKLELLIDPPDCWMPIPAAPDPKEAV